MSISKPSPRPTPNSPRLSPLSCLDRTEHDKTGQDERGRDGTGQEVSPLTWARGWGCGGKGAVRREAAPSGCTDTMRSASPDSPRSCLLSLSVAASSCLQDEHDSTLLAAHRLCSSRSGSTCLPNAQISTGSNVPAGLGAAESAALIVHEGCSTRHLPCTSPLCTQRSNVPPDGGHCVGEVAARGRQGGVQHPAVRLHGGAEGQVPPQRIRQQLVHYEVALARRHVPHHRLRDAAVLRVQGAPPSCCLSYWWCTADDDTQLLHKGVKASALLQEHGRTQGRFLICDVSQPY